MKAKILLLVILMSFIIVTTVYNYTVIDTGESAILGSGYVLILFMFFSTLFFFENSRLILSAPLIFKLTFVFGFFAIIPTITYHSGDIFDLIRKLNGACQWIFCLLLGYIIAFKNNLITNKVINYLTILTIPLVSYFILNSLVNRLLLSQIGASDIPFILLVLFPFVLSIKNDVVKQIVIFFIGIIALISFKRTTILGFIYMTLAYYFSMTKSSSFSIKKRLILIGFGILLISFLYQIFNFIEDSFDGFILSRLNNIQEDEGSGRLFIYTTIFNSLLSSSFLELIFGHGFLSVGERFQVLAHNDFLEILYDFGFIALTIYFMIFYLLIKYSVVFYKQKNRLNVDFPGFIAAMIAFFLLGLFNCFISSPVYFSTLMFYFGLAIGKFEFEKARN